MSEIKEKAKELCEKSGCHHKCHDTKDCVVEDEALLLITENKSNNYDFKSNKELFKQALVEGLNRYFDKTIEEAKKIEQIEEMAQFMAVISHLECGRKPCEECKWCGCERIEEADCTDYLIAEHLYNAGYRKQSVGEWVWKTKIEPQAQNRLYCSVCDEECLAKNNYYVKSNFCHNCGAKMKGGAE